ncbi:hypothetical protein L901_24045 [Agrobacterium sp. D14]|nr:hypothetical protein L901_24045 [Agrobacterium sp. D14]
MVARAHGFYYIASLPKRTVHARPKSVVLLKAEMDSILTIFAPTVVFRLEFTRAVAAYS